MVKDLRLQDINRWNIGITYDLFSPEIASSISGLSIHSQQDDKLIWKIKTNGRFTVKFAYKKLYTDAHGQSDISEEMKKILKLMWKLPILPKIKHFVWKCLRDIIPIKARNLRYAANAYIGCPICGLAEESASHITLHCNFSRAVWF